MLAPCGSDQNTLDGVRADCIPACIPAYRVEETCRGSRRHPRQLLGHQGASKLFITYNFVCSGTQIIFLF